MLTFIKKTTPLLALIGLLTAGPANAQFFEKEFCADPILLQDTNWGPVTVNVPQYQYASQQNPFAYIVKAYGTIDTKGLARNNSPSALAGVGIQIGAALEIKYLGNLVLDGAVTVDTTVAQMDLNDNVVDCTLDPFTPDCAGGDEFTFGAFTQDVLETSFTSPDPDLPPLSEMLGTGTVAFTAEAGAFGAFSNSGGNFDLSVETQAGVIVCACYFTFGELPVELVSFDVMADDARAALLTWTTASENNNAGFAIEVATAADDFREIGWVDGHGTTEENSEYSFRAQNLVPGVQSFRLRQVDYDGAFAYSPIVEVEIGLPDAFVLDEAYPNPFNPTTTINFAVKNAQPVTVALFDALGRQVKTLFEGVAEGGTNQTVRIDAAGLNSGMYIVRMETAEGSASRNIVLMK